ncbi:FAD-dependent oxidoreductase [Pedobacter sp. HDW13]|uniref:FAD-dependent monooxygenase n=1 Tax=unclassified Pedobacter TaxID=2628915 RepID=UPI000F5A1BD3|nr:MULTISPECIES: FAD-dependent monooxygenase [unclassified Pedobacter]QIL41553.1 FAD-dependent oxidoreductase [Pedobacter sp. HDW13]RQO77871.1 FAD-dependent oxidoreductase [Pedobacter sp. KBW01]
MNTTIQNEIPSPIPLIYDVIIAGGGPVGLFLACELALAQCTVLILEKVETPETPLKRLPFGMRGLSAPSIEALYRRGLLSGLEIHKRYKNPHAGQENRQAGHFAGIPFYADHIDTAQWKYRLPSATDPIMLSEMEEIETVLTHRALALGVTIRRGQTLCGFQQTDEGVTVLANAQSFMAKWLVGCDGSRSQVRKAGGFEFAGTEPDFTGYSAQVDILDPEKLKPGRNVTARGMYLQSQPGYLIIQDFDQGAFHQSGAPITAQHLQEVLRHISDTDVTISTLHIATTWTDRARQATNYRNSRVFLAGDAAHIHAPLGGQGLNLGLGDAMNLGWKLAATIKESAPEGLLDSYYAERYPIGIKVLEWSRAQVAIMKPEPQSQALNAIMRDLMNTHDGATYMASRIWGVNLQYELEGNHPLVGCSVPNFEFTDGTRFGELMYDGKGILLDFGQQTSLQALAKTYGNQMKYISGQAKVQLGLSAVLIRPDGFVAWATDSEPDEKSIRQAAAKWFL